MNSGSAASEVRGEPVSMIGGSDPEPLRSVVEKLLRSQRALVYFDESETRRDWITEEDLGYLMVHLDSKDCVPCVVSNLCSVHFDLSSRVCSLGDFALFFLDWYRIGSSPMSSSFDDGMRARVRKEVEDWWRCREQNPKVSRH